MLIAALQMAGFSGIEPEGAAIHARLPACDTPFRVDPVDLAAAADEGLPRDPSAACAGAVWRLSLAWALRASPEQIAAWNQAHAPAVMDLWQGETRVSLCLQSGGAAADTTSQLAAALASWQPLAEQAVAQMVRWRRAQRAPGEGM